MSKMKHSMKTRNEKIPHKNDKIKKNKKILTSEKKNNKIVFHFMIVFGFLKLCYHFRIQCHF